MKVPQEKLIEMYTMLSRIRKVELEIEEHYHEDEMKTPVHLCLGQEAVSVGVCSNLLKKDYVFSNHRSHGHYLAKGGDLNAMMAELYCKETGCSKGRGGSMHLIDTSVGHLGSSSIVGGGISHAMGAAFAARMQGKDLVAVAFFGDAASEQGVFFETMSFSALKKLPVVFVCENNFYSVCSHISVRQPNDDIYKRARAFDIPSLQIDGMNILEVYKSANEAIEHARRGEGPFLLECRVQRWSGHAGAGDPQKDKYRVPEDLNEENLRDPVADFEMYMIENNVVDQPAMDQINQDIDKEIQESFKFAKESPLPKREDLEKYLYSE